MNDWTEIHTLIGGFMFLGISIYILVISGYKNTARQCGDACKRQAEWFRRNASRMWIFGVVFALFAVGIVFRGLSELKRQHEHGIANLIAGLIGVVFAAYLIFRHKEVASRSADSQEHQSEFISRNSWLLLIVGILSGLCGILMICATLAKLL